MASISSQGKRKDAMADHVDGYVIIDQPKRQRQSETTQASRPSARVAALTEGDNSVTDIGNGTTNLIDKYGPSAPYVASINPSDIIPNKATSFSLQNNGHESIATPQASNEGFTNYQLLQLAGKAPPVWAKTRSALCDAVDYFKMHDGGNYNKRGITYGILLDGADSIRDYIDGTVIITTIGGGKKADVGTGQRTRNADQDETARSYKCLTKSMKEGYSIVVVVGEKNETVKPPFPYCVLGEYQITNIWMEKFPDANGHRFCQWMIRLEKIDASEISWFAQDGDTSHTIQLGQYLCDGDHCSTCHDYSKRIYDMGWTCLNYRCPRHFQFRVEEGGQVQWQQVVSGQAKYTSEFVGERTPYLDTIRHRPVLVPGLPVLNKEVDFGTETEFKRGIVCPKCHCASRRIFWDEWKCEGDMCNFTYKLDSKVYSLSEIARETVAAKRKKNFKFDDELVSHWSTTVAGYRAQVYTLPQENGTVCGTVFILRATPEICGKANGPNDLFLAIQDRDVDLKLKRNATRHPGRRQEELCSHFSSNWGAHYKFGVNVSTTGFADAPTEILRSVSQLSWAQERAIDTVKEKFEEDRIDYCAESMSLKSEAFNELLSLGYFESSVINYHDDGEKELGPTVATLSLGSPSVMRFRPKRNNRIGTPGKNRRGLKASVIKFPLYHGDICIMHGVDVHRYYEHEVKPQGKLRFAMTSRYIHPEAMPTVEAREDCITKGKFPDGLESLAYKGTDAGTSLDNKTADSFIVTFPLSRTALKTFERNSRPSEVVAPEAGADSVYKGVKTPISLDDTEDMAKPVFLNRSEEFHARMMADIDYAEAHAYMAYRDLSDDQRRGLTNRFLGLALMLNKDHQ